MGRFDWVRGAWPGTSHDGGLGVIGLQSVAARRSAWQGFSQRILASPWKGNACICAQSPLLLIASVAQARCASRLRRDGANESTDDMYQRIAAAHQIPISMSDIASVSSIDCRRPASLAGRFRGPGGRHVSPTASDCFDEFESYCVRPLLRWRFQLLQLRGLFFAGTGLLCGWTELRLSA